jgi:hypothetical protein
VIVNHLLLIQERIGAFSQQLSPISAYLGARSWGDSHMAKNTTY